jgi:uncharacterized protein
VLSEWAVMLAPGGAVAVNYYGPCAVTVPHERCGTLTVAQETTYPFGDGKVALTITPERPARIDVRLRIPGWSASTGVSVNGQDVPGVRPASYLSLDRDWKPGDQIELSLDMTPRVWPGERESAGKVSLYRGPILLAYDPRFDSFAANEVPPLDWKQGVEVISAPPSTPSPRPMLLARCKTRTGGTVTLCDFATAGMAGNAYASWLPGEAAPVPFTREDPWRWTRTPPTPSSPCSSRSPTPRTATARCTTGWGGTQKSPCTPRSPSMNKQG